MKYAGSFLIAIFLFAACGEESAHDQFFSNLGSLCGETFVGAATYPDDPDHDLVDTELRAHISSCTGESIEVDLYREGGDTWHATWLVERRENGLHLYHEHIGDNVYEEGEEPLTGYGGYADDRGSATRQYFPADDHTGDILPEAVTNVWMMDMDLENEMFVYYLERHDEPRFRAELTRMAQ